MNCDFIRILFGERFIEWWAEIIFFIEIICGFKKFEAIKSQDSPAAVHNHSYQSYYLVFCVEKCAEGTINYSREVANNGDHNKPISSEPAVFLIVEKFLKVYDFVHPEVVERVDRNWQNCCINIVQDEKYRLLQIIMVSPDFKYNSPELLWITTSIPKRCKLTLNQVIENS